MEMKEREVILLHHKETDIFVSLDVAITDSGYQTMDRVSVLREIIFRVIDDELCKTVTEINNYINNGPDTLLKDFTYNIENLNIGNAFCRKIAREITYVINRERTDKDDIAIGIDPEGSKKITTWLGKPPGNSSAVIIHTVEFSRP
jgi:hypothetical protein